MVETITPKRRRVNRWFYIDIEKALDPAVERDEALSPSPKIRGLRVISADKSFSI